MLSDARPTTRPAATAATTTAAAAAAGAEAGAAATAGPYRPQQLAPAAHDLAALLARGQATLDAVGARLEAEFSERFSSASQAGGGRDEQQGPRRGAPANVDPCALARRARRLERALPALRREAEEAARARRALAERAAEVLGGTRARLHELSVRAGLEPPRDQREGDEFGRAVWEAGAAAAAAEAARQT